MRKLLYGAATVLATAALAFGAVSSPVSVDEAPVADREVAGGPTTGVGGIRWWHS